MPDEAINPKLTPVTEKFILHWGEMGTRWGINRTVAQIHALLFIWPQPLNAEQIASTLSVARSNVSTSIKELQGWGIIKVVHVLGDRSRTSMSSSRCLQTLENMTPNECSST